MASKYEALMDKWARQWLTEQSQDWRKSEKVKIDRALASPKPIRVEATTIVEGFCDTCYTEYPGIEFVQMGGGMVYETSALTIPDVINALLELQEKELSV